MILEDSNKPEPELTASVEKAFGGLNSLRIIQKLGGVRLQINQLRFLSKGYHPAYGRFFCEELVDHLKNVGQARSYDLAHFDMIHVAAYRAFVPHIPALLVASDAYSMASKTVALLAPKFTTRLGAWTDHCLIGRYEKEIYPNFDLVATVSDVDTEYLRSRVNGGKFATVGIALGDEFALREIRHFRDQQLGRCRILCTGSIDHETVAQGMCAFIEALASNTESAHLVRDTCVLGRSPARNLLHVLQRFPDIEHIDFVPDYAEFLDQDWIYVYPQECGSGLQTKLQQAMSLGLPAVGFASSFAPLGITAGVNAFPCSSIPAMVEVVVRLSRDEYLRRNVGKKASEHIRKTFSVGEVGEAIMHLYKDVVARR